MSTKSVLVVEDDKDILELIKYNLQKEQYKVTGASDGEKAMDAIHSQTFDLIVLDLMLPGMDGLEICKILKADAQLSRIPIIIVSAKGEESDIVLGLELGADDYMVKPFSPRVLIARVRSVLRRRTEEKIPREQDIKISDFSIHPGKREVRISDKVMELTFTEFELLYYLARHPGWVFTRYQIVNAIKGDDYPVTDRSVDVQIAGLRKKLGTYGNLIETIRGVGYRFTEKEVES